MRARTQSTFQHVIKTISSSSEVSKATPSPLHLHNLTLFFLNTYSSSQLNLFFSGSLLRLPDFFYSRFLTKEYSRQVLEKFYDSNNQLHLREIDRNRRAISWATMDYFAWDWKRRSLASMLSEFSYQRRFS